MSRVMRTEGHWGHFVSKLRFWGYLVDIIMKNTQQKILHVPVTCIFFFFFFLGDMPLQFLLTIHSWDNQAGSEQAGLAQRADRAQSWVNGFAGVSLCITADYRCTSSSHYMAGHLPSPHRVHPGLYCTGWPLQRCTARHSHYQVHWDTSSIRVYCAA